ncbi:MFS transporter [Amycolatopsis jiangsuensis]|uniref:Sugar phosphate permease n=1 Tax=Amycolatopsis jiangsuensis TaxID=1181879 RepID=A0A840J453_9PSEU|nr:MFS transporter [Amycolatopsis jiangsuensis]MBB4688217.1 sugar phosphate permease [Amycolatopsis jiangsuensis]
MTTKPTEGADPDANPGKAAIRRISWRLMPFLLAGFLIAYIDRSNVGFAGLQMNEDIGLTASMFGFGASMFFFTYVLLEVPSNLAMARVGARIWITRIMITWGLVAMATALVQGPVSFIIVRMLLGAAEAGFFPGVILYLTYFYPAAYRARVFALFSVAIPLASIVGSPLSGLLLGLDGTVGLAGWQWLFIVEGVPAVLLGLCAPLILPTGPATAKWLPEQEKTWLSSTLRDEDSTVEKPARRLPLKRILLSRRVLLLTLIYAGTAAISQGLSLWQPQIIKSFGLSNAQVGWINAVPFAVAVIGMLLWSRFSDRRNERALSTAIPIVVAIVGLAFIPAARSLLPFVLLASVVLIGTYASKGPFWGLSTETLSRRETAAGVALINSLGSLAAFGGNWIIGVIKESTGSFVLTLLPLLGISVASLIALAVLVLLRRTQRKERHTEPAQRSV